jgi:hypothetical protein
LGFKSTQNRGQTDENREKVFEEELLFYEVAVGERAKFNGWLVETPQPQPCGTSMQPNLYNITHIIMLYSFAMKILKIA